MNKTHNHKKNVFFRILLCSFCLNFFSTSASAVQPPAGHTKSRVLSAGEHDVHIHMTALADITFILSKLSDIKATYSYQQPNMNWVIQDDGDFNSCSHATKTFVKYVTTYSHTSNYFQLTIEGEIHNCKGEGEGGEPPTYKYTLDGGGTFEYKLQPEDTLAKIGEPLELQAVDSTRNSQAVHVEWPTQNTGFTLTPNASSTSAKFIASVRGIYTIETRGMDSEYSQSTAQAIVTVPEVKIEAEGGGNPPVYIGVNQTMQLTAVVDPDVSSDGTFEWTSPGNLVTITQDVSNPHKATVTANENPSSELNDVKIKVVFTHTESENKYEATHSLTVVKVQLTNLLFNHDKTSSANDAINIRQDFNTPIDISNGEWVKGGVNHPIAYTADNSVTIMARLTVEPDTINKTDIWAISVGESGSLGDIEKIEVTFDEGISVAELQVSGKTPDSIAKTTTDSWKWKMGDINGSGSPEYDFDVSGPHTVYTILSEPEAPWVNTWNDKLNAWLIAFEFSIITCNANGQNSETAALSKITQGLYDNRSYPPGAGGKTQHLVSLTPPLFNYSAYIAMNTNFANCLDSALGLWATGGILGARLVPVRRNLEGHTGYQGFHAYVGHLPRGSTFPNNLKYYDCMPANAQAAPKINFSQEQIDNAWGSSYPVGPFWINNWGIQ